MRKVRLTETIKGQGKQHDAVLEINEVDRGEGGMGLCIELDAPSPVAKDELDPILRLLYRGLSTYMEEFEHTDEGECVCEDCLSEEFDQGILGDPELGLDDVYELGDAEPEDDDFEGCDG